MDHGTGTKRSAIEPYFANMESNTSLFVALDASTHNQQILNLSFCQKELWAVGVAHGDLTSMQLLLQCKTDKGSQTQHTGTWNWCKLFWMASIEQGFDRQTDRIHWQDAALKTLPAVDHLRQQLVKVFGWVCHVCCRCVQLISAKRYAFVNLKTGTEKPSCNFENHQSE